jgi:hypothetical protein
LICLFNSGSLEDRLFQELADSFEELKTLLPHRSWSDDRFYKALRRLYFANVATYLCQYHDDSPLSATELSAIEPFVELTGRKTPGRPLENSAHAFLEAWSDLKYNLRTNDGEQYTARDSYEFMEYLALWIAKEVLMGVSSEPEKN